MGRPDDMQVARAEPIRLTYDDYVNFPDDGRRHELIDGEQIVTPSPVSRHQELSARLAWALHDYLRHHPLGRVFAAPDLVVEVLSTSTRRLDEVRKLRLYDRFGVREYWIVDPDIDTITIYRRAADDTFPRVAELTASDDGALETPLLPGFAMKLRELFG